MHCPSPVLPCTRKGLVPQRLGEGTPKVNQGSYDRPSKPVVDNHIAFKHGTRSLGKEGKHGKRPGEKIGLRLGTLNIRTLRGKVEEVIDMMKRRSLDVLGLAEVRWKGEGRKELREGYTLYWKGNDEGSRNGVGWVMRRDIIAEVRGVSERLTKTKVSLKGQYLELLQVYAPQVGCTTEEKESFEDELQSEIGNGNVIIMGDLNAHVGTDRVGFEETMGKEGWGSRNIEGQRLLEFCKRNSLIVGNTWFEKRESHKVTWYGGANDIRKSVVDYFLYSEELRKEVSDIKVMPSEALDSDHRLLIMDLRIKRQRKREEKQERKIKVWKLKDKKTQEEFQNEIKKFLPKQQTQSVEEEWRKFKEAFVETAEKICGRTGSKRRWKETPWWNEEVKEIIKEKNTAFRKWFKERTTVAKEVYDKWKRETKKKVKEEKKKWMEEWSEMMEKDAKGSKKLLYALVKKKRNGDRVDVVMKNENGKEISDKEELKEEWKNYFQKLLNPNGEIRDREEREGTGEMEIEEDQEITWLEFEEAVKKMSTGKAAGVDELPIELVKRAGAIGMQWLYRVFKVVWNERKTPDDWKKAAIIPIFKKGDRKDFRNYRGIALMSHCAKVYEKILEKRIRKEVEGSMREEQHGFRPGRSTTDLVFATRQLQEKKYEYGEDLVMAFLDMEKAYDSIRRKKVWEVLRRKGINVNILERVKEVSENSENCVKVGGEKTEWFKQTSGLRQGSALSPLLFIIVLDEIMNGVERRVGEENMRLMAFADDIMVWGSTIVEVQIQLDAWQEVISEYGLKFNVEKSEYMITTRKKGIAMDRLMLCGKDLKKEECFKYLGSILEENGGNEKDINERIRQAGNFYRAVGGLIHSKDVPQRSKEIIYKMYYVPIITYGAESWTMKKRDKSKIQASEMRFLRARKGITKRDRIRNETIRESLGEEPLQEKIERGRLRWFGHVNRMDEKRIPKKWLKYEIQGKRPRGRPRDRWRDGVRESVLKRGEVWEDIMEERRWEDKKWWRGLCTRQTR